MRHFLKIELLVAAVLTTGCAFDDGNPWGRATFEVAAMFDPPGSRLDDGLLKTAKDFRVEVETLEVTLEAIELEVSTSGEVGEFDPANPPPGYSLCHNGHCHFEDGSLVDYEDIAVEQAGGDFVVTQTIDGAVNLGAQPRAASLGQCSMNCQLERGALGVVRLRVSNVRLVATVTDTRDRLAEPLEIDRSFPVDATVSVPVEGQIGVGEPGGVQIGATFEMPAGFLDRVDFDDPETEFSLAISGAIQEPDVLRVEVEHVGL